MRWTMANLIRTQAEHRGDEPALTFEGRTVTYGDLNDRSNQVAQALLAEGIAPQDRVAYIDKNSVEFFEVLFGVAKVNAVNATVNWRLSPQEMAQIVNDAEAKLLFRSEERRRVLRGSVLCGQGERGQRDGQLAALSTGDGPDRERRRGQASLRRRGVPRSSGGDAGDVDLGEASGRHRRRSTRRRRGVRRLAGSL